ncbi:MAG: type II toxin-antitoxin system HicA family toxin [Nitrospira sp.]|nr:type II toxin-antitoxin system HicA family toxin [Nitrospira sp.]MDE0405267.1 type II toxin-antitoxin system HicA family toxin [Nitrospira sp.]
MSMRDDHILRRILDGRSDASIRFDELRKLLLRFGFVERVRSSHHIFRKPGVPERINLQRDGGHAKPYQVRQIRHVILKHKLQEEG